MSTDSIVNIRNLTIIHEYSQTTVSLKKKITVPRAMFSQEISMSPGRSSCYSIVWLILRRQLRLYPYKLEMYFE